jgi:hypothetical protein
VVHSLLSLHGVPSGNGVQVEGVPVQEKQNSTRHAPSQPSPSVAFPSSHSSLASRVPPPQRLPVTIASKEEQKVAGLMTSV